jgi:glycosyltransferase involved in cell wall biosynthesis
MASHTSMEDTVVFIRPESIASPTSYLFDLLAAQTGLRFKIESEIEQLAGGLLEQPVEAPVVFATVTPAVQEFLESTRLPFSLLVTPQEDFSGLTQELLTRASSVVCAGENRTVPRDLSSASRLQATAPGYIVEANGDVTTRTIAEGPADVVNFICPTSYLRYWEHVIRERSCPSRVNIWTARHDIPPPWFHATLEDHGVAVGICTPPMVSLEEFLRIGGRYIRDNVDPDRLDLVLRDHQGDIFNLHHGRDLRAGLRGQPTVSLTDLLVRVSPASGAPASESAASNAGGPAPRPAPAPRIDSSGKPMINIVCYKPTYLFADLTKRFEQVGCVHSDLPEPNADGYIWLRPQEFGAFGDLLRKSKPVDVSASYQREFAEQRDRFASVDFDDMSRRSVAIHHGTCYEPIIQFDAQRLARSLARARIVAGVCELEECYGPSARHANHGNFEFIPIGYDHTLFNEEKIRREPRTPGSTLELGFVGRAYGTNDREQLKKSVYSHPKGYRKGGDHLLNILLRLKALGIPFLTHIVGQNWDELVQQCERYALPVRYYTRDKDVSYREYPSIYARFDALVISARAEGGPVSAIEAMSMGVPVVGSNVGLIPFLSRLSPHCHMFEYDTKWHIMDYERATEHLVRIHESGFEHDSRLALRKTVQAFTTDRWVQRLIELARIQP